jgi:hypothetical protein
MRCPAEMRQNGNGRAEVALEGNIQPVVLTREELYRQVWETPMIRLGEKYGISGNGLKKICNRLDVPYPPLGYWAKLRAGKPTKVPALPEATSTTPADVRISPTPPASPGPALDPGIAEQLRTAREKAADVVVPESLRRPHPLIAAWLEEHARKLAEARRDRNIWGSAYRPEPFTELDRRQQRILDTLFKAVEKRGFAVKGEAPYQLWLEVGKERIDFSLRERMKQVKRPLNDFEKRSPFYSDKPWRRETVSAGDLIFTIKTYIETGLTKEWREGERRLEEQMSEIVSVLSIAGPILREQRRRAEEAERERREEEHRLYEERAKRQQDENRWRRFVELAARWEEAALAARFIEALRELPADGVEAFGGRTAGEWLDWARVKCAEANPLRWPSGEVWCNLAEVSSWDYRQ